MGTIWTMPDGSQFYEEAPECPQCHHVHSPTMGGICVGCDCELTFRETDEGCVARPVMTPTGGDGEGA